MHPINAILIAVVTGTVVMGTIGTVWSIATGGIVPHTPAALGGTVAGLASSLVLLMERRAGKL